MDHVLFVALGIYGANTALHYMHKGVYTPHMLAQPQWVSTLTLLPQHFNFSFDLLSPMRIRHYKHPFPRNESIFRPFPSKLCWSSSVLQKWSKCWQETTKQGFVGFKACSSCVCLEDLNALGKQNAVSSWCFMLSWVLSKMKNNGKDSKIPLIY